MSMPTFPESGLDITKEQAFHMLLGSIAMEELALSHIMNAEGEKLQYILGTLPGCKPCATPHEVLAINQSVTQLMEQVNQSQLLLKGKMSQVLQAMGEPSPILPCPSPCPTSACVLHASSPFCWRAGQPFPWKVAYTNHCPDCYVKSGCGNLYLPPTKAVLLHYSFQLELNESDRATIVLQSLQTGCLETLFVCHTTAGAGEMICGSTTLHPESGKRTPSPVVFNLLKPNRATVRQASVSLLEL